MPQQKKTTDMDALFWLLITCVFVFLVLVGYVAAGQKHINERMDNMQANNTADRLRIDHIERDVHDMREENKAISEAYLRLHADVSKAIKEGLEPLNRRLERIEDSLMRGK